MNTTDALIVYLEWGKLGWRASDIGDLLPAPQQKVVPTALTHHDYSRKDNGLQSTPDDDYVA